MRSHYSIRSIILGTIASLACLLAISASASAAALPPDAGIYAAPSTADLDLKATDLVTTDHVAIVPQRLKPAPVIAVAGFEPLKPEYAESYRTHGLTFIDLYRRC
ncbi:hypothetical protein AKG11_28150 [Shinella sp. SUS2]|uniref:hypothetical protein n=1 Tax=unclassified Shinella TaxID=2643062 RepID=UPI00068334E3|nr:MULTISPECIES: hypothetical protein [unclassified Shinella]KNY13611.1 hypothetical protein AKG11_28150 [Shinella sp. SUS2]KOC72504.1 hypothetical protein AKG10_27015 [Shinella sp. GWS1]